MKPYRRLIAAILLIVGLVVIAQVSGLRDHFTLAYLQAKLAENRWLGLGIFIALFTAGNLIQVPGWIFLAAAVFALGKIEGGLATYIAACVSCAVTFLLVHYVGQDAMRQLKSKLAVRIFAHLDAYPLRTVILLRTMFQTVPVVNYALALSGIRFRQYMLGTLLGLPLPIALYCVFFDYLAGLVRH